MGQVIQIDEARIRDHLGRDGARDGRGGAERDAGRGSGSALRRRTLRAQRRRARTRVPAATNASLETKAGQVKLKMPKLRRQTFETAIIERYQRRESSVEEALIEMYLAGVSVRRVEDITEALWGTRVSPGTVSNLNKKIYAKIEEWRHRPIEGEHPYVFLDGIVMKRSLGGRGAQRLAAGGDRRDRRGLSRDPRHLRGRQGGQVRLVGVSAPPRRPRALGRRADHLRRLPRPGRERRRVSCRTPGGSAASCISTATSSAIVPAGKVREVSHMLKAIHAQENRKAAAEKKAGRRRRAAPPADGARAELVEAHVARDPDLLRFPGQPLDQAQDQQSARADHAGDPAANPRRRRIPRRSDPA